MILVRRLREKPKREKARTARTARTNGPTANKASVGDAEDCVLLDTGANEVACTGHGPKPTRSKLSPLQLADGSQVEAWRTRDGDIFVESSRLIRADVSNATWRIGKVGEPPRPGFLHPTANGRVVQFFGNQFHGTEEYTNGPRHVAIAGLEDTDCRAHAHVGDSGFQDSGNVDAITRDEAADTSLHIPISHSRHHHSGKRSLP